MGRWNLEREYQQLVEKGLAKGAISIRSGAPDQRQSPRIRLQEGRISVRLEPEFDVVDISAGGMAFLSEVPFDEGEMLHIILKDTVAFQGSVVGCRVIETDPNLMELRYRVQCRFYSVTSGKQLLVLMHEMDLINVGSRAP